MRPYRSETAKAMLQRSFLSYLLLSFLQMAKHMRLFNPFSMVLWGGMLTSMHITAQPAHGYSEELFPMVSFSAPSSVTCTFDSSYFYFDGLLGFRHLYQRDAEGQIIGQLVERHYEGLPWQPYWLYLYAYDEQGNPTEATSHSWADSVWSVTAVRTRTYDAQGMLTEEAIQHMTGGVLTNFQWHTFDYDAEGNRTDWRVFSSQNGEWVNNSWRVYTYDAQGSLIEELRRNWESGAWVDIARTSNTYDVQGILVQSLQQAGYIDQWYDGVMTSYAYDTDGNLIEEIPQHMVNGQWNYGTKSVYGYDIHGNLVTVIRHDWEAGAWAVGIPYQEHFYQCDMITADGPLEFCFGDTVRLCVEPADYAAYLWNTGSTTSCITITQSGEYWPTLLDSLGNIDSSLQDVPVTVTVHSAQPLVEANGDTLVVQNTFVSYQWFFGGTPIDGATDSLYIMSGNYDVCCYHVQVVDDFGCEGLSWCTEFPDPFGCVTDVHEANGPLMYQVYPNPTTGPLIITSTKPLLSVAVVDMLGRVLLSERGESSNSKTMDLAHLPAGIYVVHVETEAGRHAHRVVRE